MEVLNTTRIVLDWENKKKIFNGIIFNTSHYMEDHIFGLRIMIWRHDWPHAGIHTTKAVVKLKPTWRGLELVPVPNCALEFRCFFRVRSNLAFFIIRCGLNYCLHVIEKSYSRKSVITQFFKTLKYVRCSIKGLDVLNPTPGTDLNFRFQSALLFSFSILVTRLVNWIRPWFETFEGS